MVVMVVVMAVQMMMVMVVVIPVMMVMMVMMVMRREPHIRVGSRYSSLPRCVGRFDFPQQGESVRNRIEQLGIGSRSQKPGRIRAGYSCGLRRVERCQSGNCANDAHDLLVHVRLPLGFIDLRRRTGPFAPSEKA